jgi:hypothetical protein
MVDRLRLQKGEGRMERAVTLTTDNPAMALREVATTKASRFNYIVVERILRLDNFALKF